MNEHEQVALNKIRDAYSSGKPVVEEIMKDHQRVDAFISMLRSSTILSTEMVDDSKTLMLQHLEFTQTYLTKVFGIVTAMHGMTMVVNAIMSEHSSDEEKQ
jgi:hypothetical protein